MIITSTALQLCNANLPAFAEHATIPTYDRGELVPAIVHIGVGGFHRAHQAVYLDDLLGRSAGQGWGICGFGVLEGDRRMRDALKSQDYLYTVIERSAGRVSARIIGSIVDFVFAPEDPEAALERLASEQTRIISFTVTEGGYFIDDGTGALNLQHSQIAEDLGHPERPLTWLGYVLEALQRRRQRGLPGLTLMSCDNLQSNGDTARAVFLAFAAARDPGLRDWIAANVTFPNSMVDRITPATTPAEITFVADTFGINDKWPVVTEPFLQWVIEDQFCQGRPAWENVGAQLVHDVVPYELMKMRLLNGSHLAMAYLGALSGYTFVHEIMQDSLYTTFVRAFMEEVTPVVPVIPGTSVAEYKTTLISRFSNPTINDQVTRICSEGSAKLPKWVLPSIVDLLAQGASINLLSLLVASWIHYLAKGVDELGRPLAILDARATELVPIAKAAGTDPSAMLAISSIFGEKLPGEPSFRQKVGEGLRLLSELGARQTVQRYPRSMDAV